MTYKSVLAYFGIDSYSPEFAAYAADIARRFDARLVGVSAATVHPAPPVSYGVVPDGEILEAERTEIETQLGEIGRASRSVFGKDGAFEWRHFIDVPTPVICREARAADLIVVSHEDNISEFDYARAPDVGEVLLSAGRPVLVAGADEAKLKADHILIAWKDSREARRAVMDAMPFLTSAKSVLVTLIGDRAKAELQVQIDDVAAYLALHGVRAVAELHDEIGDSGARLMELASDFGADLVIGGAYGHSRLREWIFGGVTKTLLESGSCSRFFSN